MSTPVPDMTQCRALLEKARLQVRRHKALLKLMDKVPAQFLDGNGRRLVHEAMLEAMDTVHSLESRVAEFASALAAAHRKRS